MYRVLHHGGSEIELPYSEQHITAGAEGMDNLMTWLARWVHVSSAAFWVGGFAVLALVIIPYLLRAPNGAVNDVAIRLVRVLSFSGLVTLLSGFTLVYVTRGFGSILRGEWGGIIIGAIVLTIALGAIGDAALRPSLRRAKDDPTQFQRAQRLAMLGLVLSLVTIALMTRAIYARS